MHPPTIDQVEEKIEKGFYTDYHARRPLGMHEEEVGNVLKALVRGKGFFGS